MIQSMTGYGAAERVEEGVSYAFEVRSVNHRYLKVSIRLPEQLQFTEPAIERIVRDRIARGSISCALHVQSEGEAGPCPINAGALQQYVDQLSRVRLPGDARVVIDLGTVAALPGVIRYPELDDEARQRQLELVCDLANRAMDALIAMRLEEGRALCEALRGCSDSLRSGLGQVAQQAPKVVDEYHERLKARVSMLVEAGGYELQEDGLMREIAVYADRCDISEEVTRLGSHLDQFAELCEKTEPVGRTLDFLTQELLREANTVASKSNNAAIARNVVEMKALIDRMKEQVQNVE